jgi:cysteine desulfurase / selenocysteine lyase
MMGSVSSSHAARLGDRGLFSAMRVRAYCNHAGIAPASDLVRAAVERVARESAEDGSVSFVRRLGEREELRRALGALINAAQPDAEIAFVPSTMYGLCAIALSIPWKPGDRVIAFEGEYPTNVTAWQRAAELFGLSVALLPVSDLARPSGPDFSRLDAELAQGGVRVCAASAVQFQTGFRMPLAELATRCHAYGAELAVDAVQAIGAVPFDVRALGVDYLAAGAHKWLMGSDGAGFVYVRRTLAPKLRVAFAGAMSHQDGTEIFTHGPGHLRYDRPLRDDARAIEGGMLSSGALASLAASVATLRALGVAAIYEHIQSYHDRLEAPLTALGFRSLRPFDPASRSGILSFMPPAGSASPQLVAALAERGVVAAPPDGVLRFSPHFWNSLDEISIVVDALRHVL